MYDRGMKRIVIHKNVGETPLMALEAWKAENPQYKDILASYAGRLDPMAQGKLIILFGEECKKQSAYTNLDKEYEIEVLLDVGSDTGDALGLIEYPRKKTKVDQNTLGAVLRAEEGTHVRAYPKFSSKTVNGKPLFLHTLEGNIDQVVIPEHEEHIYNIILQNIDSVPSEVLASRIDAFLNKVPKFDEPSKRLGADFRLDHVRTSWEKLREQADGRTYTILTLRITCGSGTYMRSLAGRIGEALGTKAIALSINRTKIGKYWHGWWLKTY